MFWFYRQFGVGEFIFKLKEFVGQFLYERAAITKPANRINISPAEDSEACLHSAVSDERYEVSSPEAKYRVWRYQITLS